MSALAEMRNETTNYEIDLINASKYTTEVQKPAQVSVPDNNAIRTNVNVITLHLTRSSTNESFGFVLDKNSTRLVRLTSLHSPSHITA